MKLCDEAAATAAIRHSRARVVTAAVDRMTFVAPVHVGDLLTLRSSVNAVWRTSMEVGVRVHSEDPISGEVRHTNSAYITLVAVDEDGHPVAAVPPLRCESPDELRREREAQVRRANRLAEREQLLHQRKDEAQPAEAVACSPKSSAYVPPRAMSSAWLPDSITAPASST